MGTKQSIFQPDHTGKRSTVPVHPGMVVTHASHPIGADMPARHGERSNIARDSTVGKHINPTPVHGGMTRRQLTLKGMQHANEVAPDANPASPLSKEPQGKNLKPVAPAFGQRSRTAPHDPALGAAIMNEAMLYADNQTRMAYGIDPRLPDSTSEQ